MKTTGLKRVLSLTLTVCLMLCLMPLSSYANEPDVPDLSTQENDAPGSGSATDGTGNLDSEAQGSDSSPSTDGSGATDTNTQETDATATDAVGGEPRLTVLADEAGATEVSTQESLAPLADQNTRIDVENAVLGKLQETIDDYLAEANRDPDYTSYTVLKITGVINQKDFDFICEKFENLTDLDLQGTYATDVNVAPISKLQNLFLLKLNGTEIEGKLEDFASLVKLMSLEISTEGSPTISGDLEHIKTLTVLGDFQAAGQNITGNLQDLGTKLAYLVLSDTNVSGDISNLTRFLDDNDNSKAENIFLANTKVYGDLKSLEDVTSLKQLDVSNTLVEGDLSSLSKLTKMEILRVADTTDIIGSYDDLLPFASTLYEVNLSNTLIGGDLARFNNLPEMLELYLANSPVSGNIGDIKNLPKLRILNVNDTTSVGGDIAQLAHTKTLNEIHVRNSQVVGDISGLSNLEYLNKLVMDNTKLTGDISAFANMTNFNTLSASNTALGGNLASLSNAKSLIELNLSHSAVVGDIASLKDLPNIQAINLSGSNVSGDIASLKNLILLKLINLSNTHVYGNVAELYKLVDLVSLTLSNVTVIMPALTLDAFPLTQAVPVRDHLGAVITPQNIKGGSYDATQGTVTWNKPASLKDTLSYTFSTTVTIGHATAIYSGTVLQPLTAYIPATGDTHAGLLLTLLLLSALLTSTMIVRYRRSKYKTVAK